MESSLIKEKEFYNLSEPQKRIYFSENLFRSTPISNICCSFYLHHLGNWDFLTKAINYVLKTNDGIRLQISKDNGNPQQYIAPYKEETFEIYKIENQEKWIREFSEEAFDLYDSRLFKVRFFYDDKGNYSFVFKIHHIISDAWTLDSITKQIDKYYTALLNGGIINLEQQNSYLDYLDIEQEYKTSKRYEKSGCFWNDQLKNDYKSPNFNVKNKIRKSKASRCQYNLTIEQGKKINSYCEENKISVPNFFFSLLFVLSRDYCKNNKIAIGTLTHNRVGKKEKTVTGMYVNTLPVCIDVDLNNGFNSFTLDLTKKMAGIMRHQRFPLSDITNCPELTLVYTYENVELPIDMKLHYPGHDFFPMVFRPSMRGSNGIYKIEIDYQVNILNSSEIDLFYKKYLTLLNNIIEGKNNLLTNVDETDSIKPIEFNNFKDNKSNEHQDDMDDLIYSQNHNPEQTLHRVFEKRAVLYSENKAISFADISLTYYELNRRANYLASKLLEKGAGNESPVVLLLDRSLEMMISILAVLKTGSCYLPLSPDLPISRTNKILELSGASIVLYNTDFNEEMSKKVFSLDVNSISYPQADVPNLHIDVKPDNLAYIIYTSGSTGEPKGVMIEHKSVINRLLWMQEKYPLTGSDIVMQKTPYTFDVSIWELFGWYLNGSVLHFLTPGAEKEPETIAEEIQREKVSIIHFVPSMLTLFLEYIDTYGSLKSVDSIRRVSCSGEAILTDHVNKFKNVMNKNRRVELYNLYGPTEATVEVSFFDCLDNRHDFVPIGKAIDNVELYVLDEHGEILPPGSSGELFIGGVCLARGYFNRPELTDEKFKVNSTLGKRLYSTGDLATYLDDGNIKYLGRIDNQVKIRGNRVELGEIESCLLSFNGILEAAVTAPIDENGNAYLGAYIVAESEMPHEDLRHFIQNELPSYMVPSYFVQMDKFPLSTSGKLDRKALIEPEDKIHKSKKYHAPVNEREEEICEIWEDVLKLEKIGRHDNFFSDLGGDSLSLIQVLFPLKEKYELELQDLFEFQTIEALSQHIHQRTAKNIEFKKDSFETIVRQRMCINKVQEYNRSYLNLPVPEKIVYSNLLITGSTGFLGAYLVKDYLENSDIHLFLLVRGDSLSESQSRFEAKMFYYFGNEFYGKYSERITVVNGDIATDEFGMESGLYKELCETIEGVVHSAASVKHYGDRTDIYNINVNGTKNVLTFCNTGLLKRIFFVSTVSIGLNSMTPGFNFNFIETDVVETNNRGNVYIDSKILAEEAVRGDIDRLGGQILRVGNIVNDLETGKFQENRQNNAFYSLMMEYKKRNKAPNIELPFIDLSFVNETASAIRVLSMCNQNGTFHLYNPDTVTVKEMCNNQDIKSIEFEEFITTLEHGDSLLTHGYYLNNSDLLGLNNLNNFTNHVLGHLGFSWSPICQNKIDTIWSEWLKQSELDNNLVSITSM